MKYNFTGLLLNIINIYHSNVDPLLRNYLFFFFFIGSQCSLLHFMTRTLNVRLTFLLNFKCSVLLTILYSDGQQLSSTVHLTAAQTLCLSVNDASLASLRTTVPAFGAMNWTPSHASGKRNRASSVFLLRRFLNLDFFSLVSVRDLFTWNAVFPLKPQLTGHLWYYLCCRKDTVWFTYSFSYEVGRVDMWTHVLWPSPKTLDGFPLWIHPWIAPCVILFDA